MEVNDRLIPGEDPEIVGLFIEQVGELVGALREKLKSTQEGLEMTSHEIMRMVHRFKGDAQFLQLPACYQLADALERSCSIVFEKPKSPTQEAVRVLKRGLDLVENRCRQPREDLHEAEYSFIQQASEEF